MTIPKTRSISVAAALTLAFATHSAHSAPLLTAEQLYQANCAACHGAKMEGAVGPPLNNHAWIHGAPTKANLIRIISKGVPEKNMPAWSPILSAAEISLLASHIETTARTTNVPAATKPVTESISNQQSTLLAGFSLPKGFSISVYAEGVETARSMAVSDSGVVYVGSRKAGKVYALVPRADKRTADVLTVAEGLDSPIGVTLLNGALYVAEIGRIIRFDDIDRLHASRPSYQVLNVSLPSDRWHGEKIIRASPDGKLYVPVGAPCNICDTDSTKSAKIYSMDASGGGLMEVARGVRNTVGFAFHPVTNQLWFTDNGRDQLGDNIPSCELNVLTQNGQHFGFPYCHGGAVSDPKFGMSRTCSEFVQPIAKLGPHVAPLGIEFYTGKQFPQSYRNNLFVAEHGSWNRVDKIGYTVRLITLNNNELVSDTPFIEGFLRGNEVVGRPVDVAMQPDGALLVSDDYGGRIFRVTYKGK